MNSQRFKVVVTDYESASLEREEEILSKIGAKLVPIQCKTEDDLIAIAGDADGLLNLYFGPISRKVIESLKKCKIIFRYGIGVDTIDVEAATERGIIVTNVPSYCVDEVSDHTIALILCCARKIPLLHEAVKKGGWDFKIAKPIHRLKGRILGLIGFGQIGRSVRQKAKSFGFDVISFGPYMPGKVSREYSVRSVSLDVLLEESDFVSIYIPLNKETYHLLGKEQFKLMKDSAFLVNTARGGVVDQQALHKGLRERWIAGAALDVVEEISSLVAAEPFLELESLIVTPHSA